MDNSDVVNIYNSIILYANYTFVNHSVHFEGLI